MRTHSGKTTKPGTSRGRANTTDSPQAPTLDDTLAVLVNASANNTCILQTWAQCGVPVSQGCSDSKAINTYCDFMKTKPPIFHS